MQWKPLCKKQTDDLKMIEEASQKSTICTTGPDGKTIDLINIKLMKIFDLSTFFCFLCFFYKLFVSPEI
jgi:hypothetical protein